MNKHFSEILKIMDAAESVPDEIKYTETRNIMIVSENNFHHGFKEAIENYCNANELEFYLSEHHKPFYLIKNPKNP